MVELNASLGEGEVYTPAVVGADISREVGGGELLAMLDWRSITAARKSVKPW